jgi:hypothetical protein
MRMTPPRFSVAQKGNEKRQMADFYRFIEANVPGQNRGL